MSFIYNYINYHGLECLLFARLMPLPPIPGFPAFKVALVLFLCLNTLEQGSFFSFFKSLLNLLQFCSCFMLWFFRCEAYGISAPWPGISPPARHWRRCLDHWSAGRPKVARGGGRRGRLFSVKGWVRIFLYFWSSLLSKGSKVRGLYDLSDYSTLPAIAVWKQSQIIYKQMSVFQ